MNQYLIGFMIIGSIALFSTILVLVVANFNGFFNDEILNCVGQISQSRNGTFVCLEVDP